MSKNFLCKNCDLHRGDYLLSNNGEWKAIFQNDGNLVVYGWKPVWASDTAGSDVAYLCMQDDCNLVMYNKEGAPRWHTNSHREGNNLARLHLTDDGTLLVFKNGEQIWSSAKSRGQK